VNLVIAMWQVAWITAVLGGGGTRLPFPSPED